MAYVSPSYLSTAPLLALVGQLRTATARTGAHFRAVNPRAPRACHPTRTAPRGWLARAPPGAERNQLEVLAAEVLAADEPPRPELLRHLPGPPSACRWAHAFTITMVPLGTSSCETESARPVLGQPRLWPLAFVPRQHMY
jgi:hypothetical protein